MGSSSSSSCSHTTYRSSALIDLTRAFGSFRRMLSADDAKSNNRPKTDSGNVFMFFFLTTKSTRKKPIVYGKACGRVENNKLFEPVLAQWGSQIMT